MALYGGDKGHALPWVDIKALALALYGGEKGLALSWVEIKGGLGGTWWR